jgi:putative phosphoribosyl transferase
MALYRNRCEVDRLVCAATPEPFQAVGLWYDDSCPTSDDEVQEILRATGGREGAAERVPWP